MAKIKINDNLMKISLVNTNEGIKSEKELKQFYDRLIKAINKFSTSIKTVIIRIEKIEELYIDKVLQNVFEDKSEKDKENTILLTIKIVFNNNKRLIYEIRLNIDNLDFEKSVRNRFDKFPNNFNTLFYFDRKLETIAFKEQKRRYLNKFKVNKKDVTFIHEFSNYFLIRYDGKWYRSLKNLYRRIELSDNYKCVCAYYFFDCKPVLLENFIY